MAVFFSPAFPTPNLRFGILGGLLRMSCRWCTTASLIVAASCTEQRSPGNLLGIAPDDDAPVTATFNPNVGTSILPQQLIVIEFSRTMQPDTVVIEGSLAPSVGSVLWSQQTQPLDAVVISPDSQWPVGVDLELALTVSQAYRQAPPNTFSLRYNVVDVQAPSIVDALPDGSAIEPDQPLSFTFSEPLNLASVRLTGPLGAVDHVIDVVSQTTVSFQPSFRWPAGSPATGNLNAQDLAGNSMTDVEIRYSVPLLRAFVTSAAGPGDLSQWPEADGLTGLSAGDRICQNLAQAAGYEDVFVAWLSDNADDAYCRVAGLRGRLDTDCGQLARPHGMGPWFRPDSQMFADLLEIATGQSPAIVYPLSVDETGASVADTTPVWTGTSPEGRYRSDKTQCDNWSGTTSLATIGRTARTVVQWTTSGSATCNSSARLYCLQQSKKGGVSNQPQLATRQAAFLTTTTGPGVLAQWPQAQGATGVVAGDAICQAEARTRGLTYSERYRAWLSTPTAKARDRISGPGPWVRPDGAVVAANRTELFSGVLSTGFSQAADGTYMDVSFWSGTAGDGTASVSHCANWTSGVGSGATGASAFTGQDGAGWSAVSAANCELAQLRLLCFETR